MIELATLPEQHFEATEYAESDLLVLKYFNEDQKLILCLDDLSEKIPDWVSNKSSTTYSCRYKVIWFEGISRFRRLEVEAQRFRDSSNDFCILQQASSVPILPSLPT